MLDYKTSGKNSYVFQDKNIWKEFMESPITINDKATSELALNWVLDSGGHAGKVIGSMYGIGEADWESLYTISDLFHESTALTCILNHDLAFTTLLKIDCKNIMGYHIISVYNKINNDSSLISLVKNELSSYTVTNSSVSYNNFSLFISGISNAGKSSDGNAYVHAFVKSGLNYKTISNNQIVLATNQHNGWSGYGLSGHAYETTTHVVDQIVSDIVCEKESYSYTSGGVSSGTASVSSTITYIPLTFD